MDATLARVLALTLVSALSGIVLVLAIGGTKPDGPEYTAVFTDSSGMIVNSDVRAAGIVVGEVRSVDVRPDNLVEVVFTAEESTPMTTSTQARIRYKNVVGDRFLELLPGPGPSRPLPPHGVIPVERTRPALDLDELYNGFAPLFEGLQPRQVNELTASLVGVLQDQGGAVTRLLTQIASLTGALADKDVVIGEVVGNLNILLGGLDQHRTQLDDLVVQLTELAAGLNSDRGRISRSLDDINDLTASLSGLLREGRPDIKGTVHQVDRLAAVVNADAPMLDERLHKFPGYYAVLGRLGAYSSAFQFYLCGVQVRLDTGTGPVVMTPMVQSGVRRCHR